MFLHHPRSETILSTLSLYRGAKVLTFFSTSKLYPEFFWASFIMLLLHNAPLSFSTSCPANAASFGSAKVRTFFYNAIPPRKILNTDFTIPPYYQLLTAFINLNNATSSSYYPIKKQVVSNQNLLIPSLNC